ncbi:hypothetical protein FRC17_003320 [Serendipita sp. 399]|nr:hypothetical protein FRC17_003320 [Serendipita sp. 399]
MFFSVILLIAAAFSTVAWAQQSAWGQCGGNNWTGLKTCVTGYHCQYFNAWYSQCVPTCGGTTLYSTSAVVGTGVTAIPTTTTLKPFASYTTVTQTACISTAANGSCAAVSTRTYLGIWDFFYGLTVTTTVTKPVSGTIITSIPVATTTLPCYKREVVEEREVQ